MCFEIILVVNVSLKAMKADDIDAAVGDTFLHFFFFVFVFWWNVFLVKMSRDTRYEFHDRELTSKKRAHQHFHFFGPGIWRTRTTLPFQDIGGQNYFFRSFSLLSSRFVAQNYTSLRLATIQVYKTQSTLLFIPIVRKRTKSEQGWTISSFAPISFILPPCP